MIRERIHPFLLAMICGAAPARIGWPGWWYAILLTKARHMKWRWIWLIVYPGRLTNWRRNRVAKLESTGYRGICCYLSWNDVCADPDACSWRKNAYRCWKDQWICGRATGRRCPAWWAFSSECPHPAAALDMVTACCFGLTDIRGIW